jgi:hypothetical protein
MERERFLSKAGSEVNSMADAAAYAETGRNRRELEVRVFVGFDLSEESFRFLCQALQKRAVGLFRKGNGVKPYVCLRELGQGRASAAAASSSFSGELRASLPSDIMMSPVLLLRMSQLVMTLLYSSRIFVEDSLNEILSTVLNSSNLFWS